MAELKTTPNRQSVSEFLDKVEDEKKRADCYDLLDLMQEVTSESPHMWGDSIVGFGSYHYRYASGREGDWFLTGFSPRKQNLSLYIMAGFDRYETLMEQLGKYKAGKSCLYIKRLEDVDRQLVEESVQHLKETYG